MTFCLPDFDHNSWNSFWPNFVADSLVAMIFSLIFVKSLNYFNRPRLALFAELIAFKNGKKTYSISILNEGNSALKSGECNCHFYLPNEIPLNDPEQFGFKKLGNSQIHEIIYSHFSGDIMSTLFPRRHRQIIQICLDNRQSNKLYYHFSTINGNYPTRVWKKFWYRKITDKRDYVIEENLPFLQM